MTYDANSILIEKEEILQNETIILSKHNLKKHIKTVCVGDFTCGKTSMIFVLSGSVQNTRNMAYIPTLFDNHNKEVIFNNDNIFTVGLWDTAGEDYNRPLTYPGANLFIICFSIGNPTSFENVTNKWIKEVRKHCPNVPVLLCGTKVDLREDKKSLFNLTKLDYVAISKEEGIAKAKEIGAIGYIETSSFEAIGFEDLDKFIVLLAQLNNKELRNLTNGNKKCLLQ